MKSENPNDPTNEHDGWASQISLSPHRQFQCDAKYWTGFRSSWFRTGLHDQQSCGSRRIGAQAERSEYLGDLSEGSPGHAVFCSGRSARQISGDSRPAFVKTARHVPRRFSRDYDSLFLITPFVIVAAAVRFFLPGVSRYAWLAILVSGASVIALCERINRQYRVSVGSQWSLHDLLLATTIVAANLALWNAVM